MTRDTIIQLVASLVGPGHEVNLKDYDLLIVVEVYQVWAMHAPNAVNGVCQSCRLTNEVQNVCGVSVVDGSFERLKRYNLAEIFDPTQQAAVAPTPTHMGDSSAEHATPLLPATSETAG